MKFVLKGTDIPRDPRGNTAHRRAVLDLCADPIWWPAIRELCKKDILWWINTFLYTYDPRKLEEGFPPDMTWRTWPVQDRVIPAISNALGKKDIGCEKSRDMGFTWNCLAAIVHRWQFFRAQTFLLSSRMEKLVDAPGDPDTLFWKVRYLLKWQPPFMVPKHDDLKLHLINKENGSTIDGAASTEDLGRGGRRTAVLLDEFAAWDKSESLRAVGSTAFNTNSTIFNSTHKGTTGGFYRQMQRHDIVKITVGWWDHPERGGDLGKDENGDWLSPWYREKCHKLGSKALIAEDLDIKPGAAAGQFFPEELLLKLEAQAREPRHRGRVEMNGDDPVWIDDPNGPLILWCDLNDGRPPPDQYAVGSDIATGNGATPSVSSVASKSTREKVAELMTARMSAQQFAESTVALCRWFHGAFLIWEKNGPGISFGNRVVELGYSNIYLRQDEQGLTGKIAANLVPGWQNTPDNFRLVITAYLSALSTATFCNPCKEAIRECRDYTYDESGRIVNPKARDTLDNSEVRQNHADRVIADALCNKGMGQWQALKLESNQLQVPSNPPPGSLAHRRQQYERELQSVGWESSPDTLGGWDQPVWR